MTDDPAPHPSITGFYVRIERDGKWGAYDIAELTDAELERFFSEEVTARKTQWLVSIVGWIRDHVKA